MAEQAKGVEELLDRLLCFASSVLSVFAVYVDASVRTEAEDRAGLERLASPTGSQRAPEGHHGLHRSALDRRYSCRPGVSSLSRSRLTRPRVPPRGSAGPL